MSEQEELLGADWVEHRIKSETFSVKIEQALAKMGLPHEHIDDTVIRVRLPIPLSI